MSRRTRRRSARLLPYGTIAYYGPDNTFANKLVAVAFDSDGRELELRHWTTLAADVRHDPVIAADVAEFFAQRGVGDTVAGDRIIGCPHEEGIDYPLGRTCPRCPFWDDIDRFTHQPLTPPRALMSPDEVLQALSEEAASPPLDALESADAHRGVLLEPLLAALDRGIAAPRTLSDEDAALFSYALYLVAHWRETRALPYVIRWLSLPEDDSYDLSGDIEAQDGPRILASVASGDLAPIKALVENPGAGEFGRSAALGALALLAAWREVPYEHVASYFTWLAEGGLDHEAEFVWDSLVLQCVEIGVFEAFPALRAAFANGRIDTQFIEESELDEAERTSREDLFADAQERYPPVWDVAEAIAWWNQFSNRASDPETLEHIEPYRAPGRPGRNEPCPCGSGKKFKKCCGA